jgi:hypothetical protein
MVARLPLLKKLSARERLFLTNFMSTNCKNEYTKENYIMDLQMYKYPNTDVLLTLYTEYIDNYDLLVEDMDKLVEKKCENHVHKWRNKKIYWDLDAKDVKCTICGEERHVEIDSSLGEDVI